MNCINKAVSGYRNGFVYAIIGNWSSAFPYKGRLTGQMWEFKDISHILLHILVEADDGARKT